MNRYQPPFTLTNEMLALAVEISEQVACLPASTTQSNERHLNHIRSVTASLAIEGSTLDEAQITSMLEGDAATAAPAPEPVSVQIPRKMQKAHNALAAYMKMEQWQPYQLPDLLAAHQMLMQGVSHNAGAYRSGSVGIMAGQVPHLGPAADQVPHLMASLFDWLARTDAHPLISSAVFHYEFAYIRPFVDGNGPLARLWHTRLLSQWRPLFSDLSLAHHLHQHQQRYCQTIKQEAAKRDATPFIHFMLSMIKSALPTGPNPQVDPQVSLQGNPQGNQQVAPQDHPQITPQVDVESLPHAILQVNPHVTPQVEQLLTVLEGQQSREELQTALGLSDRKSFRQRYLQPALEAGLIEMTRPNTPQSCLQSYQLTTVAKARLTTLSHDGNAIG